MPFSYSKTSPDYLAWIQPNLPSILKVLNVLMKPYNYQPRSYGYDANFGMFRGANIEQGQHLRAVGGGTVLNPANVDAIVIFDNNAEGGPGADAFNDPNGPLQGLSGFTPRITTIYANTRSWLRKPWDAIGSNNVPPYPINNYPVDFLPYYDRREAAYGYMGDFAAQLVAGGQIGGIGGPVGSSLTGQTWFNSAYETLYLFTPYPPATPLIVTAFPNSTAVGPTAGWEMLSFYIQLHYLQGDNIGWRQALVNGLNQTPGAAPRESLHLIAAVRSTGAWLDATIKATAGGNTGLTAMQIAQKELANVFTNGTGPNGGIYQNYTHSGSEDTPEPNCQLMQALNPYNTPLPGGYFNIGAPITTTMSLTVAPV